MTREELLRSPEYWILELQEYLFGVVVKYMKDNSFSKEKLSKKFECSKNCINKILAGEFDGKISQLIKILLVVGKVPIMSFKDIEKIVEDDKKMKNDK